MRGAGEGGEGRRQRRVSRCPNLKSQRKMSLTKQVTVGQALCLLLTHAWLHFIFTKILQGVHCSHHHQPHLSILQIRHKRLTKVTQLLSGSIGNWTQIWHPQSGFKNILSENLIRTVTRKQSVLQANSFILGFFKVYICFHWGTIQRNTQTRYSKKPFWYSIQMMYKIFLKPVF